MNNDKEYFWIFGHLGLGDHIVCNSLYRFWAEKHKDKFIILPVWEHNLAAVQWSLEDVKNVFFYPIEREQQLLDCMNSIAVKDRLCLGFYAPKIPKQLVLMHDKDPFWIYEECQFNPVKWDSEFYRQAGLDPELKWSGFKFPELEDPKHVLEVKGKEERYGVVHEDQERGFLIDRKHIYGKPTIFLDRNKSLKETASQIYGAGEINCIDSSILNLSDLMPTPYCKRFVFHRYARRGLPPTLKKNWEIID